MSVRYKFKNDLSYTTLNTDGFHISVRDLKKAIVEAKKLGRITDFDLVVSESSSDHVFANDDDLIPKNTSLIIARHPLPQGQKKVWEEEKATTVMTNAASTLANSEKLFNQSNKDLTEDDKISQMMSNSTEMYSQKNWLLLRGRNAYAGQKVPSAYKCNRCGQHGHFIYDCPQGKSGPPQEIKRTTGIPRSFLVPATSETPGAKINPQGLYMVNEMEKRAYTETKIDRPVWEKDDTPFTKDVVEKGLKIPDHLKCPVCQDLLKDAVMMPSCACCMCDECARDSLIKEDNTKNECPVCAEPDNSPDDLIPVRQTREEVLKFRTSHIKEEEKAKKKASALNATAESRPTLPDIPLPGINASAEVNFDALAGLGPGPLRPTPPGSVEHSPSPSPEPTPKATPVDFDLLDRLNEESQGLGQDDKADSTPRAASSTPELLEKVENSSVGVGRPPPGYEKGPLLPTPVTLPTSIPSFVPPVVGPPILPAYLTGPPPGHHQPGLIDDPLAIFEKYLDRKDGRRAHYGRSHHRGYRSRSRSRSPPPYYRGRPRGRRSRSRSPPSAYSYRSRSSRYNSPPSRYRDGSPPPKIERRAPPPPRGPRTPPSPRTPPPGEHIHHASPLLPPGTTEEDRETPLADEKPASVPKVNNNRSRSGSPASVNRTPSLSPEPETNRGAHADRKRHPDHHRHSSSREYEQTRFYERPPPRSSHYDEYSRSSVGVRRSRERRSRSPPPPPRHHRSRSRDHVRPRRSRSSSRTQNYPPVSRPRERRSRSRDRHLRSSHEYYEKEAAAAPPAAQVEAAHPKKDKKAKKTKKEKKRRRSSGDFGSDHEASDRERSKAKKAKKVKKAKASPERDTEMSEDKRSPSPPPASKKAKEATPPQKDDSRKKEATPDKEVTPTLPPKEKKATPPPMKKEATPPPMKKEATPPMAKEATPPAPAESSPSPVKPAAADPESDDDTLEVNFVPEKSKWEISDDEEDAPKARRKEKQSKSEAKKSETKTEAKKEAPVVHASESEEEEKSKKKKKKRKSQSDSDEDSSSQHKKAKKAKKSKKSKESKEDKKLKKLLLQKLSAEDTPNPELIKMAMMVLGADKAKVSKTSAGSRTPEKRSKSPRRKVVEDGANFTVTVGPSSSPKGRKVMTKSRSRSASPKRKSIKDRLGPSTSSSDPSFKQDHWNGKAKPGKAERNGGSHHSRKAENNSGRSSTRDRRDARRTEDSRRHHR